MGVGRGGGEACLLGGLCGSGGGEGGGQGGGRRRRYRRPRGCTFFLVCGRGGKEGDGRMKVGDCLGGTEMRGELRWRIYFELWI